MNTREEKSQQYGTSNFHIASFRFHGTETKPKLQL